MIGIKMSQEELKGEVAAIMVVFHPDKELLRKNLSAISPQVGKVFIIDNTPGGALTEVENIYEGHSYIRLGENKGIATAQNRGINEAIKEGYETLYFLDQDSVSPSDIIQRLSQAKKELEKKDIKVGAIGPLPINRESGLPYIPTAKKAEGIEGLTEVRELISSGSLISSSTLKEVGGMMEELFIDGVDHEWCWRAKAKGGYRFFVVNDARLSHQLGRGDRKMLWWKVAMPSPIRTYYLYRNIFILGKRNYVPLPYKIKNAVKLALKIFYYPIFISPRREYARNIFKGIKDGLLGV
ncbi:MAG: glycosyltransferase family 2 protein [Muribaculaceae bacterium]|nr:glycosyltransferase family 2 protein [Muribaculaceae bacterium]